MSAERHPMGYHEPIWERIVTERQYPPVDPVTPEELVEDLIATANEMDHWKARGPFAPRLGIPGHDEAPADHDHPIH